MQFKRLNCCFIYFYEIFRQQATSVKPKSLCRLCYYITTMPASGGSHMVRARPIGPFDVAEQRTSGHSPRFASHPETCVTSTCDWPTPFPDTIIHLEFSLTFFFASSSRFLTPCQVIDIQSSPICRSMLHRRTFGECYTSVTNTNVDRLIPPTHVSFHHALVL